MDITTKIKSGNISHSVYKTVNEKIVLLVHGISPGDNVSILMTIEEVKSLIKELNLFLPI